MPDCPSAAADTLRSAANANSSPNWWHVFAEFYRPVPETPAANAAPREGPDLS